jgi:hypothetical protein
MVSSLQQLRALPNIALAAARSGEAVAVATIPPASPAPTAARRVAPVPRAEPPVVVQLEKRLTPPAAVPAATPSARWLDDVLVEQLLSDEKAAALIEADLDAQEPE